MDKKIKKMPERQCLGCNGHFPKNTLLRVVRAPDGVVSLDFTGKKSGRGAYICTEEKCRALLGAKKLLNKAFSAPVGAEVYERIEGEGKN